jgi:hypothetical protein
MHITWIQTLFTQTVIVNYSESVGQGFQLTSLRAIQKKLVQIKNIIDSLPSNKDILKALHHIFWQE